MTPIVFDVFALLGLRPMSAIAHPLMAVGTGPEDDFLKGVPMGYTEFIKHAKGTGALPVTYKEECLFYLYWICRFLACTSSKRVINYYLPIARYLANGVPVDMASFLLGELYRAMFLLSTKPKQSHEGPIWSFKCGSTPTSPRLLLNFILPSCHGLTEKPGCMLDFLKKRKSPPSLRVSNFSVIHLGGGHLKSSCLLRQKSMVLRISKSSQAKASSEETQHGVLVSNRGTWWLLGPTMLVSKHGGEVVWACSTITCSSNLDQKHRLDGSSYNFQRRSQTTKCFGQGTNHKFCLHTVFCSIVILLSIPRLVEGLYG